MTEIGTIAIVVLTYQRTRELGALLPQLDDQIASVEHQDFEVVVVDNDPLASARSTVATAGSSLVRYVHEPAPGIAHARNRALSETTDADLLVFIDDDERPLQGWLGAMLEAYASSHPTGVTGPLYPDYELTPEDWIVAGGFFVRKQYPEGHLMPAAGTGNLLLDLRQVRALGVCFDERFGLTGGSDTLFTRQLIAGGGRIVWAGAAGLIDKVPAKRLTRDWVLHRYYRVGNTWSRTSLALVGPGPRRLALRFDLSVKGVGRMGYGTLRSIWGRLTASPKHQARGQRAVHRGRGMVVGAWGVAYQEYRRPIEASR